MFVPESLECKFWIGTKRGHTWGQSGDILQWPVLQAV